MTHCENITKKYKLVYINQYFFNKTSKNLNKNNLKKIERKVSNEYNEIYLSNLQNSQNVSLETHPSPSKNHRKIVIKTQKTQSKKNTKKS